MTLTWRPLTRDDAAAIAELATLASQHDGTPEVVSEQRVAEMFGQPRFDPEQQTLGAWSGDRLVAQGEVWPSEHPVDGRALVMIPGTVHPDHRGQGVGSDLLRGLEQRAVRVAAGLVPGVPVRVRSVGGLAGSSAQQLLEDAGYVPDNYFVTMQVALADWPDPGSGSDAVAPTPEQLTAARDAHNDAFRDHRNFSPVAADRWQVWQTSSVNRPALARVVLDDDDPGRVLAYATASEETQGVVHTDVLGTRREARGRGLAKQLLVSTLRAARDAGYHTAELEVDTTSPTGADRLYERVGYRPVRVVSRYVRDVLA